MNTNTSNNTTPSTSHNKMDYDPLKPAILLRSLGLESEDEEFHANKHFNCYSVRSQIQPNDLVVCRYSALPFFNELVLDVHNVGAQLLNNYAAHQYCASFDYYYDIEDLTFKSWERLDMVPRSLHSQPFVVKGRTNSRKQEWTTKMFAQNFHSATNIAAELMCDGLIGQQGVIIRKYEPLETFETSVSGLPFTNEWRTFFLGDSLLSYGYYWGAISDDTKVKMAQDDFLKNGLSIATECAKIVSSKIPFCAIDVAKTQNGQWMVVELNDGQQAGLNSTINPDSLYENLKKELHKPHLHWLEKKTPEHFVLVKNNKQKNKLSM